MEEGNKMSSFEGGVQTLGTTNGLSGLSGLGGMTATISNAKSKRFKEIIDSLSIADDTLQKHLDRLYSIASNLENSKFKTKEEGVLINKNEKIPETGIVGTLQDIVDRRNRLNNDFSKALGHLESLI